jgi:hypothetical protein
MKSARDLMARYEREVEACRRAGGDPSLTQAQRLGAIQGEVDWLVARLIAEEERGNASDD